LAETEQQLTTLKVNFEDLEKRKKPLTFEKKPKWKCYRQKLMRLKARKDL
jgi:hypothetical protein